ncbi:putative membrane protein [Flavobacterium limnosediminis JC2902]|uniref:Putative membrane protein n=1 Tax=Flavobacterium limnosediminis JC2902 TaxID=1341181 RepID=V6SHS0_9FLAO|nr:FUSC family membrane protein [Flavobacterium limnosediminis]ESU26228.1 putative membrane protein [Flavobacterium limnosediminis JC2902]
MIDKIRKHTDNTNFANALKATIACVLPVIILSQFDHFQEGFAIAIGALLTFPSDVPGSLSHKIKGILIAVFLITTTTLVLGSIQHNPIIVYPVLLLLLFFFSMISVYGHRANMISFVCLITITLAFSHSYKGWELVEHSAYILIGGLFYLFISLLFYFLRPHRYMELQIADCLRLTSRYMKLRGDLWNVDADRTKITEKQLEIQVEINAIHENIREYLFRNTINSSNSNENRKMLIVFTNLVEILEIALSFSFNHNELHQRFDNHPKTLRTYQHLAYNIAATLKKLSQSLEGNTNYTADHSLFYDLEKLQQIIETYQTEIGTTATSEGLLMLKNMQHYAEKQIEKIKIIEKALIGSMNLEELKRKHKEVEKFLTPQNYRLRVLVENLSFSSTTFRHSLRLTLTILAGFIIGKLLPFQNGYWILLTIVVIMRPGYGLTKQRSFERIFGTVIGGIIAFGILYFVDNHYILGTLSVIAMILGFTYSQINYKIGATFVTIYVIFIFGMLTPNITEVVQYRILDTLLGAALAFIANYFLWPSWEFLNLNKHLEKSIAANRNYLKEITLFYNQKGEPTTDYKVSRKQAFIEIGNLMASFQRMKQEPKSKQKNMAKVYKAVVVNHTLLSSAASLGTYVQSHKTTEASQAFNIVADTVMRNLDLAIETLKGKRNDSSLTNDEKERLDLSFSELKNIRVRELKSNSIDDEDFQLKMEEAQLVIDQLIWLINLSENLLKVAKNLTSEE